MWWLDERRRRVELEKNKSLVCLVIVRMIGLWNGKRCDENERGPSRESNRRPEAWGLSIKRTNRSTKEGRGKRFLKAYIEIYESQKLKVHSHSSSQRFELVRYTVSFFRKFKLSQKKCQPGWKYTQKHSNNRNNKRIIQINICERFSLKGNFKLKFDLKDDGITEIEQELIKIGAKVWNKKETKFNRERFWVRS